MAEPKIRYTKAPAMSISYNCRGLSCGRNTVRVEDDLYVCTDCGTSWEEDDAEGELYEERNGEPIDAPAVDPDVMPPPLSNKLTQSLPQLPEMLRVTRGGRTDG